MEEKMKKLLFVICVVLVSAAMLFASGAPEQKRKRPKLHWVPPR
jgi:hypothetical protein